MTDEASAEGTGEGNEVTEGDPVPAIRLEADDGATVSLDDFRGRKVVLYFYPRDDTPGCTTEACGFRDSLPDFENVGAVVLGVSPDSAESHRKFKEKHGLSFTLLADEDREAARAFGVWKKKKSFGREHWGVERSTFLIDEDGRIQRAWRKVRPSGHPEEVLSALEE